MPISQGFRAMNCISTEKLQDFIRNWMPVLAANWSHAAENPAFGNACCSLGFEMDCAHSLQAKYPKEDVFRASFLRGIIHSIDDVQFLGTAIFSYWRYLTHWHEAPPPDDAPEWFAIAFAQLSELADSQHDDGEKSSKDKGSRDRHVYHSH